jgi:hypothetical protein
MTELEALNAIYGRWLEGWAALHPSDPEDPNYVPIGFGNEAAPDPSALGVLGCWGRVEVQHTTREQTTMGAVADEEVAGNIFVQLFGPLNKGAAGLAALATDARTVLGRKRIGDLVIRTGETRFQGEDAKKGWYMTVVVFSFFYEEQSTSSQG